MEIGGVLTYEGSNCFRQRLLLSTLSGKPVRIRNIRSKADDPGLRGKYSHNGCNNNNNSNSTYIPQLLKYKWYRFGRRPSLFFGQGNFFQIDFDVF